MSYAVYNLIWIVIVGYLYQLFISIVVNRYVNIRWTKNEKRTKVLFTHKFYSNRMQSKQIIHHFDILFCLFFSFDYFNELSYVTSCHECCDDLYNCCFSFAKITWNTNNLCDSCSLLFLLDGIFFFFFPQIIRSS